MNDLEFYKVILPFEDNLFEELSNSIEFEKITNGRIANHLVRIEKTLVPIIRTTSKYNLPAQKFSKIHNFVISTINQTVIKNNLKNIPYLQFNNSLIEIYESTYSKMNFHSDQSLDLENNSFIGLFSCYENPEKLTEHNTRKLKIKDKITNEESELFLTHNSVILFSTETNMKFQHKIVLDIDTKLNIPELENRWLGMTFRTSKTYLEFKNNLPFFENGEQLKLASEEKEKEFFKLRGEENKSLNFVYPFLNYTISYADLLLPKDPIEHIL
ncbi:MAG: alpha-ketoglutarate-dependent dioxygenase AlkB [Bacteroidota bacterium]